MMSSSDILARPDGPGEDATGVVVDRYTAAGDVGRV